MTLQRLRNVKYIIPYVYKDLQATGVYLPVSIAFALSVLLVMVIINTIRKMLNKQKLNPWPFVCFMVCLEVIFDITLLSRTTGYYSVDLGLFATWKSVNSRNKAYVIENILLFVPYGFSVNWLIAYLGPKLRLLYAWLVTTLIGIMTTGIVELAQYYTARGHFQVDDLVMNSFGAMLGGLGFAIVSTILSIIASKRDHSTRNGLE